jgi:hypothetical protein
VRTSGRLQLTFKQALQMRQPLGVVEDGFEWPGFAQKYGRCASR